MGTDNRNGSVTVIAVQRERFSTTRRSLESLLANTAPGFRMIYVDAGSPRRIKHYVAGKAAEAGFDLVREEHFLSPVQARNIGLSRATTKYVAFVDNDVLFAPGWLEALVNCAEETGADVVTPLMFQREPAWKIVHVAGGTITISDKEGRQELTEIQRYWNRPLAEVDSSLKREPTGMAEFHCLLARKALFERIGPLDEHLLATSEHLDFSLMVSRNGGTIYFEPLSRITYTPPPPLRLADIEFFSLRWSDGWIQHSEDYFFNKWNIVPIHYVIKFARRHRKHWLRKLWKLMSLIVGARTADRVIDRFDEWIVSRARRRQDKRVTDLLQAGATQH